MEHKNINPDNYLESSSGRIWTHERNKEAWNKAYKDFESSLKSISENMVVYIVFGVQGSGKSTWISNEKEKIQNPTIFFDAAMPKKEHRKKVIEIAKKYSQKKIAVWINVSIDTALERNQKRPKDKRVPNDAVNSVYAQLEPPSKDEGFTDILVVNET